MNLATPFVGVWSLIRNEPVGFQTVIQSGIALGTAFGLGWNATQIAATLTFTQVLLGFLVRAASTPNPAVQTQVTAALNTNPPTSPIPQP